MLSPFQSCPLEPVRTRVCIGPGTWKHSSWARAQVTPLIYAGLPRIRWTKGDASIILDKLIFICLLSKMRYLNLAPNWERGCQKYKVQSQDILGYVFLMNRASPWLHTPALLYFLTFFPCFSNCCFDFLHLWWKRK